MSGGKGYGGEDEGGGSRVGPTLPWAHPEKLPGERGTGAKAETRRAPGYIPDSGTQLS